MMNFAFWHEILLVVQTGMAHLIDLIFFAMNKDKKYMPTFSHIGLPEKSPNGGGGSVEGLQTLGHLFMGGGGGLADFRAYFQAINQTL